MKVCEIFIDNSPSQYGVWLISQNTFGNEPLAVFKRRLDADAFALLAVKCDTSNERRGNMKEEDEIMTEAYEALRKRKGGMNVVAVVADAAGLTLLAGILYILLKL